MMVAGRGSFVGLQNSLGQRLACALQLEDFFPFHFYVLRRKIKIHGPNYLAKRKKQSHSPSPNLVVKESLDEVFRPRESEESSSEDDDPPCTGLVDKKMRKVAENGGFDGYETHGVNSRRDSQGEEADDRDSVEGYRERETGTVPNIWYLTKTSIRQVSRVLGGIGG